MKNFFIPTKKNNYKPYLLRKACLVFYTVIMVVVNTFGGVFGISQVAASSITSSNIISLTNAERSAAGLNTLNNNSKLAAAAMAKAENMFEEQYWDHFGPNGETPWQFIIAEGYNYVYAGENLAKGFRTAEGVVEAWMASPTHKENILSKNYKDIGIAVKEGTLLGKETILVVQMFGNLTTDVYGDSTESSTTSPVTQTPVIDSGQIKSISITNPKSGDILNDSSVLIEGFVEGDKDDYVIEILNAGESVGEVASDTVEWTYNPEEQTWEDGEHDISAEVKGTSVTSDTVSFTVDTVAPAILRDTLLVQNDDGLYTISFETTEDWESILITNGEDTYSFSKDDGSEISLSNFFPGEEIVLSVSDQAGNTSSLDISEYFIEAEEEETFNNFDFSLIINSLGTSDGINIIIASFVLILISIEVYILWKKGKLGKNIGELFVIALWVVVLSVGVFKGFGGVAL